MRRTRTVEAFHVPSGRRRETVVVEEPLEIRLNDVPIAVTMRTPGHDLELALGFLITEGVLRDLSAVKCVVHCADDENVVDVRTADAAAGVHAPAAGSRALHAYAGCGVCGKATIEAVYVRTASLENDGARIQASALLEFPSKLRQHQTVFDATGALHAAGLFDAAGEPACVREDVGRHNAVDKLVGWAAMRDLLPLTGSVLMLSGRCGFELVQKALVAGIPIVASISGPSSLAIDLARASGMTLACFVRGSSMSICSREERIVA